MALDVALQREQPLFGERQALSDVAAAKTAILAVDVNRDGLEVLDEQRLEPRERSQARGRPPQSAPRPLATISRCARGVAVEMIDERGIEALLCFERWSDDPPDEASE